MPRDGRNRGAAVRGNRGPLAGGGQQWRGRGGHWRHRHRHRHFPAFAFGSPFYYGYGYGYADNGCYQWRQIETRRGWRWARVNVCDYY
jgi:hypothetical protein